MNNKKRLAVLSTAALGTLIATALTSNVYAKTTDILAKDATGKNVQYSYTELVNSYMENASKNPSPLFDDYLKNANRIVAFNDDVVKGYVDYKAVVNAYMDATAAGKGFDSNAFTEKATDKVIKITDPITALTVKDGKVIGTTIEKPVDKLTVDSVSAINKTQVKVVFNAAVDAVTKENFSIDGGITVTNAKLSDDRKSATLDISGVKWSTNYNLTATNILVSGNKMPDAKNTFKSIDVNAAYDLKIVSKDPQVTATTGDNTVLTFQLLDKATGKVDTNANNMVLSISTTYGTLANTKLTVQNGQATVLFTGEYSAKQLVAKIDAQIIEASGDYKELIGKVAGTLNVAFVPAGTDVGNVDNKPILVAAGASQADRVILYFNKDVTVDNFVEKDKETSKYLVDGSKNAKLTEGTKISISNDNATTDGVYTNQKTIRGFRAVEGNSKAIEVILAKDTILTDNATVFVKANISKVGNTAESNFILTDARRPEPVSVGVEGLKTINVNYSESIADVKNSQVLVDAGKLTVVNTTVGDFDQATGKDLRNVLTVETKEYMTAGNHAIQLSGISDFAGMTDANNICTTQTLAFDVAKNDLAPTATVTVESPEQYRVKFNTAVGYKTAAGIETDLSKVTDLFKLMRYNTTTSKYDVDSAIALTDGVAQKLIVDRVSDSEYVVEVAKDWTQVYNTQGSRQNYYNDKYALAINTVGDKDTAKGYTQGLVNPANGKVIQTNLELGLNYEGSAMNTNDTVSPVIADIQRVEKTNDFNVIMTKPVKLTDKDNAGNTESQIQGSIPATIVEFQGKDKDGKVVTLKGDIQGYSSTDKELDHKDDKTFRVTLTDIQKLVDAGHDANWTLIVRSISDDVGNTAATLTKNFTVEKSAVEANKFRVVDADDNKTNGADGIKVRLINEEAGKDASDKIFITFTEGVKYTGTADNATNVANYTLNGDPLPKATNIQLLKAADGSVDDKTIVITLPNDTLKASDNSTIVLNKALKAGNGDTLTWEHEFVLPQAIDKAAAVEAQVNTTLTTAFTGAGAVTQSGNTYNVAVTNPSAKLVDLVKVDSNVVNNVQSVAIVGDDGTTKATLDVNNVAAAKDAIKALFPGKDVSTLTLADVKAAKFSLNMAVYGNNYKVNLQ